MLCQLGPYTYEARDWTAPDAAPLPLPRVVSRVEQLSPPTRFGAVYRDEVLNADNVSTCLHANVTQIETTEAAAHATAVRVACLSGNTFRVKARLFVLACGGIENARLLLLSNTVQPAGLGNQHDLVGRYFMEHLLIHRAGTVLLGGLPIRRPSSIATYAR